MQIRESRGGLTSLMENKVIINEKSFQRIEKKPKELGTVYHRSIWKDIASEI